VVSIVVEPGCERGEGLRRRSRERGLAIGPETPRALDGMPIDHEHAVSVVCDASLWAKARAGPP